MATSPRITRRIQTIKTELAYIEQWLANNPNGIANYHIGSRALGYLDPLRVLQMKDELEDELDSLLHPGNRFRRAFGIRG